MTTEQEILQQEEQLANAKLTLDLDALQRMPGCNEGTRTPFAGYTRSNDDATARRSGRSLLRASRSKF